MTVRKISKEYENVTRCLDRNAPAYQPTGYFSFRIFHLFKLFIFGLLKTKFKGNIEELKQKHLWKKYIEWEKSNPLKSEDLAQVARRGLETFIIIVRLSTFLINIIYIYKKK